jgi:transposase
VALVAPTVDTGHMNEHLRHLSEQVGPQRHVILILDGAGWHGSQDLQVPANVTLHHLPPYSPELNPVERIWHYLKQHYLSNRVFRDQSHVHDETIKAWNYLEPEQLLTLCYTPWLERLF